VISARFCGFEYLGHVLDGVVFSNTCTDRTPIDALLTENVVLGIDEDDRRIGLIYGQLVA
jgi:hypothetical protein